MVEVSVVLVTKRKDPKFEYALESLKEQTISHSEFELIIVDGCYHERKNEVLELIKNIVGNDFHVLYIGDKPSRWKGQRCQISNARNTALIFADSNSKYIVQVDDCTKMDRDWLEKHLLYLESGYLVAGSWIGYQFTMENGIGVQGCYGPEGRSLLVREPHIVSAGWFYGQNCSYPLSGALDINGFDEDLDGELGQEDISLGIRLERNGYKTIFDPTNVTHVYMSTHNYEKMITPVNIRLKDGKEHFSNERITERLLEDKGRVLPYGNCFNLRELRKLVKEKSLHIEDVYLELEKYVNPDIYDWRDGWSIPHKLESENRRN
jgi:glycosyltransferase involved in cell wall biosynthesis